jgi:type VI protein secretion system component Hcp
MLQDSSGENTMSDHKPDAELSPEELNEVNGGVKPVDKSSVKLFTACATGEHISTELAPTPPTQQELPNAALDEVVGGAAGDGKVAMQDFHFVKKVDKSSAKLV